jgi:hypothetical protein
MCPVFLLIKNAINEGGQVVDFLIEDLGKQSNGTPADYDLAIIGLGPAGLSAAVIAHQRGLRYVALDQEQVVATIQQTYQAGSMSTSIPPISRPSVSAAGGTGLRQGRDAHAWLETVRSNGSVLERIREL